MTNAEWLGDGRTGDEVAQTDSNLLVIVMRMMDGRPEAGYREVLLHEILHVCFFQSSMQLHTFSKDESDQEEYTVQNMAIALLPILRDNPHVVEYLMGVREHG